MSKKKYSKKSTPQDSSKKVVITTSKKTVETGKRSPSKTASRFNPKSAAMAANQSQGEPLLYGRQNYMLMGLGVLLMLLGYALMSGGAQPNPEVWDESIIYSFRRITLGPLFILTGIIVEIVAIFKK